MASLNDDLRQLCSIEEFLDYFALAYDPRIVSVSRLHILKRFNQYLARESLGINPSPAWPEAARCRALLLQAYEDFVHSSGVEQKVFKVFRRTEQRVSVQELRHRGNGERHA